MTQPADARTRRSLRRALLGGTAVVCLLTFGVGGWAVTTELSGAVIAPGFLVVDSNVKKVQHPTGGIIAELRVRDGSEVRAGDVVARLDDTLTRANLAMITKSMDELMARQARLKAEQDGGGSVSFPAELVAREADSAVSALMREEARLFEARGAARNGEKAQLTERLAQLRQHIQGMTEQVAAKEREIELITRELTGVRELWQKNLTTLTRVTALERDAARIDGERGALTSSIAQARARITETELQILQIDQNLRTETGKELAEVRGRLAELSEKHVAAEDQLRRVDIRTPQDGVVHQMAVHTVGGVINPAEPLMLIVPRADALTVEARIAPQDIDQVRTGRQTATLRFSAFNQRTTPEIEGQVSMISADATKDEKTATSYYTIRITPRAEELGRLNGLELVPGMPVESFIQTGDRTVISYLTKPLHDQITRAWRER
jgi:HlyD family secretion protein